MRSADSRVNKRISCMNEVFDSVIAWRDKKKNKKMKRRHVESAEADGVSSLLRDIELGANGLLAQRKRGERVDSEGTHAAVMGALS